MKKPKSTTAYLIVICAFLLAVNVSLGYVLTRQSNKAMRSLIESRMLDVANTAASMLDGDALAKLEADDTNTPAYQSALRTLTSFEENIELEYIYCVRHLGDGNFVFMIDPDPEAPGAFGDHIPYTDALFQASLGKPAVDKEPYQDRWGRFYSAYSPVFDSSHQVAGIIAVDFSAKWYEDQVSNQVRTTLLISGFSLLVAVLIIALIAARFRERFHSMLNEMNVISNGIETLVKEMSPGTAVALVNKPKATEADDDEIATLANRIQSLEEQLSSQIALVQSRAYVDGLTGLGNRTAYEDHVDRLNGRIGEEGLRFSLALLDLNGLKEINDHLGHDQGDKAIMEVATVLNEVFGGEGTKVYRIGGDEFLAILESDCPNVASMLQTVSDRLEKEDELSVAKGHAEFDPLHDSSYREVFKRADSAMYDDKKAYYQTHKDRRRR